jgi:hypothetical protein
MNLKIMTDTETLFDDDLDNVISDDDEHNITSLDNREVVSYTIIFQKGVILKQTHRFEDLVNHPELIKQVEVKIK